MRVVLTALFSERYPASGESHGLSVLAGQLRRDCAINVDRLDVVDMVAIGRDARLELAAVVRATKPDLVGVSVTYGTFSKLAEIVPLLRGILPGHAQIAYGGALASYLAKDILREIDPRGVVFVGEAELSFASFVKADLGRAVLRRLPNVVFKMDNGDIVETERTLATAELLAVPDRSHLSGLIPDGIQLYAEASRACSWAHCTFCLRGLLDIRGVGSEYRRMPVARVLADVRQLKSLGGTALTFADEDLLGDDEDHARTLVETIELVAQESGGTISFDASATVHSIYASSRPPGFQSDREEFVRRLKASGLRKIFLGVESGSPGQLKRFAKGHTRDEAIRAISILRQHDVSVELGWIMFDPLCTLSEIRENVIFLIDSETVDATSYLFNELRLQRDTAYQRLLDTHQRRLGVCLYGPDFDRDTLSYSHTYADPRVAQLVGLTRRWSAAIRPIHYPLKNMTRYGVTGALESYLAEARTILSDLRLRMCDMLLAELERAEIGGDEFPLYEIDDLMAETANRILAWIDTLPANLKEFELVRVLSEGATGAVKMTHRAWSNLSANKA